MADRTGQQLGNYRLIHLLGHGGFAEVYLGEHIHLGTQAAIKLLHTQLAGQDIDFFRQEARTIARLVHPHIVRVFDFGIEGETPFLAMDYAPNGTVRKQHPKGVALPLPRIQSYVKQIADALQYAHDEHFIHRDVKPENLLIGRRQEILLSDFGIALIAQTSRSQSMQDVAGTASYMAPEQFQGKPRPASDQYAVAVMVYEWLAGTCPFHGSFTEIASQHLFVPPPPLKGRMPSISPAVEQVVMTALAKDPHHRFGSVQAFATAFGQASQVEPSQVLLTSQSLPPAETSPQPAQAPTEPINSPDESFIATELIIAPTEPVTPPGQISLPPTVFAAPLDEASVPPTELALLPQEAVPDSDAARPSNGTGGSGSKSTKTNDRLNWADDRGLTTAIKPSGNDRKRSRKRTLGIITAVLLVIVVCGGIIIGAIYGSNQASIAAARATSTAIPQANTTNIAQIDPNVARSNPDPYPPTTAQLTLYDPMSDNSNQGFGWEEITFDDGSKCQFANAGYDVSSPAVLMDCNASKTDLNNFAFEVQMTINAGNCGGIIFRQGKVSSTYYYYEAKFCQDGSYNLLRSSSNGYLVSGSTSQIRTGLGQSNIIAVVANGDKLDLYVNQQKIASAKDDSFSHGSIGVLAFINSHNSCDVVYHKAKVWTF